MRIKKSTTVGPDSTRTAARTAAPELAPYVGEGLYPPLGVSLSRGKLTVELSDQLLRYRSERDRLVAELRGSKVWPRRSAGARTPISRNARPRA